MREKLDTASYLRSPKERVETGSRPIFSEYQAGPVRCQQRAAQPESECSQLSDLGVTAEELLAETALPFPSSQISIWRGSTWRIVVALAVPTLNSTLSDPEFRSDCASQLRKIHGLIPKIRRRSNSPDST